MLPSNFGRNQLHANSLTARLASTALTSDEGRQNFQLRPEIAFPLRRNPEARTQIVLTLGGRVMWGPDGRQVNTNGGVWINYRLDRSHTAHPAEEDPMRFSLWANRAARRLARWAKTLPACSLRGARRRLCNFQ